MKIIKMCIKDETADSTLLESRLGICFYKVYDINEMFQLINLMNFVPNLILIDLDQIEPVNLLNFINTIKTLLSCNIKTKNHTPIIGGLFGKDTDIHTIKDAISFGISGLVPEGDCYSTDQKEHALRELIIGNYHIPTDILDKIYQIESKDTNKIITYFGSSFDIDAINELKQHLFDKMNVSVNIVNNIQRLFELLSDSNLKTDYICLDITEIYKLPNFNVFEILNTINTIIDCMKPQSSKLTTSKSIEIIAAIGEDLDPKKIREVINIPIMSGVVLKMGNKITVDQVLGSWENIINNKKETPKLIKEWIKPKKTRVLKDIDKIILTDRQTQVLTLIQTRGSSNKVIAKTLNLSESTVKLHIGAILKKYGLRNRTQLALFTLQQN